MGSGRSSRPTNDRISPACCRPASPWDYTTRTLLSISGDLDGLCGLYAVVNAACFLCPEVETADARDLFRVLNDELRKRRCTSNVVWAGMCPALVWPMLLAAKTYLREALDLQIEVEGLTFRAERATIAQVWSAVQDQIGSGVAVLSVSGRHEHWSVAYKVTPRTMRLLDSGDLRVLLRSRCTIAAAETGCRLNSHAVFIVRRQ
jgi:hypothetical protein